MSEIASLKSEGTKLLQLFTGVYKLLEDSEEHMETAFLNALIREIWH